MSNNDRTTIEGQRWYKNPLLLAFVFALSVGVVGIALASTPIDNELKKALFTDSVALVFGVLFGGIVKLLIDDHQKLREQRANQVQFLMNVLADLKAVYDRVERTRILIWAHRSALTYGKEMRDLIDARVQLRNVIRALDRETSAIRQPELEQIQLVVSAMEAYLAKLTNAFEKHYRMASVKQKTYETKVDRIVKEKDADPCLIEAIENEAWKVILDMPETKGFLGNKITDEIKSASGNEDLEYTQRFERPLDLGTWILRDELQFTLGHKRAAMPKVHADTLNKLTNDTGDAGEAASPA
jgi:hypothetical protein